MKASTSVDQEASLNDEDATFVERVISSGVMLYYGAALVMSKNLFSSVRFRICHSF